MSLAENKILAENGDNTIHIVFICDENYVMPTVVAITSIYTSKESETVCAVHVISVDVSDESKATIAGLSREKFEVEVIDFTQNDQLKKHKIEGLHVSTAAVCKFFLPTIFYSYKRILYLDGDILVKKDLSQLYNLDLQGKYAAVVKDYKPMLYSPPQVEKLHINHSAYFNSGVMLLNLEQMRQDDISKRLLEYRINGINYFMDQDALNVVFQEKVNYLPLYYNVMSSVMGYFKLDVLVDYYELAQINEKSDIYDRAVIVHLCTKYKPWDYYDVPFAREWLSCYQESRYPHTLQRRGVDKWVKEKLFAEIGLKATPRDLKIDSDVLISLTSFPDRIQYVPKVIQSLLRQSVQTDKILLWLAEEQFEGRENDLPQGLLDMRSDIFEIRWCDDLKPHKKYYYAMQQYPEAIIITVDDDVEYEFNLVETLLESYKKFPFAVSAMRAHLITVNEDYSVRNYAEWKQQIGITGVPSLALCATGIGGILYPPGSMSKELFNKQAIFELCLYTDDLWLKMMQMLAMTPVVLAAKTKKIVNIDGSQESALWIDNVHGERNDRHLCALLQRYNEYNSSVNTLTKSIALSSWNFPKKKSESMENLNQELCKANQEIRNIQASMSYRIGRFITLLPRKIRGGVRCYREHGFAYTWQRVLVHFKLKKCK